MSIKPEDEQELFDDIADIADIAALATKGMDYEMRRVGEMRSLFIKIFRITRHWHKEQL